MLGIYLGDGYIATHPRTYCMRGVMDFNPRYYFTNFSSDIQNLLCDSVEKLGLNWAKWGKDITVGRKADVAFFDKYIGAKS